MQKRFPERTVYKYFNIINWRNTKIILVQEHYLDNKEQLLREENTFITKHLQLRRKKEYYKEYYNQNKEH